jgi:hypothetical protein
MAFPERLTLRAMWITVRNSSDFPMHPLHATLEEFATEGYTHQLPALLRDTIAGNRPACENLDGTHHCADLNPPAVR